MIDEKENVFISTINKLNEVVDVDSIVGKPIKLSDNICIVPICKMTMGLIEGGSDIGKKKFSQSKFTNFAGASGTGVNYQPVGIVAVVGDDLKYISLNNAVPYFEILETIKDISKTVMENKNDKNKK